MRLVLISGLLVSLLMFVSCIRTPARKDFAIADSIIAANNKKLAKEGFECFGSGGSFPGTIKLISLSFTTQKYQFESIKEVRLFFYKFFQDYAKPFNEEKRIRPYLHRFPIDAKMLELVFVFRDTKGQICQPPNLARVQCIWGIMTYFQYDPISEDYINIYTEPFDKAQRLATEETRQQPPLKNHIYKHDAT
jgi:hypothetical protein